MLEAFSLNIIIFERKETKLDLKALYFLQIVTGKLSNEKRSTTGNRIDQNTTHSYLNLVIFWAKQNISKVEIIKITIINQKYSKTTKISAISIKAITKRGENCKSTNL